MSMSCSYKRPQKYVQTVVHRLDGEDVKSLPLAPSKRDPTCTLKKRSHLHPQKEPQLHPQTGVLLGHSEGPEIDIEKCRFSLGEMGCLSVCLMGASKNGHSAVQKLPSQHHTDYR